MPKFLQQLQAIWAGLTARQKATVVAAGALAAAGLWYAQQWNVERDYKPLYTDMSQEEAASVVSRLRELNISYRLNETGTTVMIPSARRAETRLEMATRGLPQHGRIGFELFDQSRFGATEFAEHVNYRRALEGELERSVVTLRQVEHARVHISMPKESVFLEYQQPAKASVIVQMRRQQRLETDQVRGVAYLVASAVDGLSPDMVSVLDVGGRLLNRPRKPGSEASGEELELQQKVERETAQKVLHTLEPYLGPDKARASVSADVEMNAGEKTEEVLDPNAVLASSQKSEEEMQPASAAGPPGTASNVPRGAGRPFGSGTNVSRKQEQSSYQISKTLTRMKLEKGAVKRLSVAVLVDHKNGVNGAGGRTRSPRTPQEMKVIRDLVIAAAGIVASRGDLLTIENLPFEGPESLELRAPVAAPGGPPGLWELLQRIFSKDWLQRNRYALMGAGVGVILVLAGLVLWYRKKMKKPKPASAPQALPNPKAELERQLADREQAQAAAEEAMLLELKMPQVTSSRASVLRKVLATGATKNPGATAQMLRTWIHEDER